MSTQQTSPPLQRSVVNDPQIITAASQLASAASCRSQATPLVGTRQHTQEPSRPTAQDETPAAAAAAAVPLQQAGASSVGGGKYDTGHVFPIKETAEETWESVCNELITHYGKGGFRLLRNSRTRLPKRKGDHSQTSERHSSIRVECESFGPPRETAKAENAGSRRARSSKKVGCGFRLNINWNKSGTGPTIGKACLVHNHDPPPAGGRPGFLSYEEVKASEGTIRELCRTNLTTAKICRFLERDGLGLGPVGKMQVANAARRIRAEMNDAQNGGTDRSEGRVPTTQGTQKRIGPPAEDEVGHSFAIGGAEWEEGHSAKRVVEAIVYADLMAVGKKFATQASSQVRTLEAAERIVMKLKAAFDIALTAELATANRADAQSRGVSSGALPPASRQTVAPATAGAISTAASARAPATAGKRGRGASGGRALGSCRGRGGRGGRGGGQPARLRAHEKIHDRGSGGPGDVEGAENSADKAADSTRPAAAEFSHVGGMGGVGVLPEGPPGVAGLPQNTPTGAIDGSTDASLSSGDLMFSGERSTTDFRQATGATGSTFHAGRTDRRDCVPPPPGRSNIETAAGVGGCGSDQAWSGASNVGDVGSGHGSNQAWGVGGSGGGGHGGHVMGSGGSGGGVGVGVDGSNRAGNDSVGVAQGSSQPQSGGGVGDHGSDQARRGGVGGYGSDQLERGDGASAYRSGNEGNVGVGVDVGGVGAGGVGGGYDTNRAGRGGGVYDRAVSSGSNMAASEDTRPPLHSREDVAAKRRKKRSRVQGRG